MSLLELGALEGCAGRWKYGAGCEGQWVGGYSHGLGCALRTLLHLATRRADVLRVEVEGFTADATFERNAIRAAV